MSGFILPSRVGPHDVNAFKYGTPSAVAGCSMLPAAVTADNLEVSIARSGFKEKEEEVV